METLVLSAQWEPVRRVKWQHAMTMWAKGLVEIVESYEDTKLRTVTFEIKIPSVVRYVRYRRPKRRAVRFSRENIYTRDNGFCQYCGDKVRRADMTYDHVKPRKHGGQTTWENVVLCCGDCNQKKGGRTPEEAGMRLRERPKRPSRLPEVVRISVHWEKGMPESWIPYCVRDVEYWHGELENDNGDK